MISVLRALEDDKTAFGQRQSHHPLLMATGRYGCWAECWCGWQSGLWTSVVGAHLEFGEHLVPRVKGGQT